MASSASAVDIASDSFESGTYLGGMGWTGDWATTGSTYPWYASHDSGTWSAFLNGQASISRVVDTTGYSNVHISFWVWTVAPPVTVSYTINGVETNLVTINSASGFTQYEYDLPAGVTTIKFNNDGTSSVSYIDDITITGDVAVQSEVLLTMEDNYVVGSNAQITLSSTEADTIHTLQLSYPNGTIFCEKSLLSPSVAQTSFSTICELPGEQVIDAKAYFYVSGDESINTTQFFNVVNLDNNPTELNIEEVYFSEQVLQGGSTEIFAVIDTELNISNIRVELTFPDNTQRIIPMYETQNPHEYRAFITDTYRDGNTSFKIVVETDTNYAEYENQYVVAKYSTDFVDVVQDVRRILEPEIQVHGTEYRALDPGRMFIQLLDGYNAPINDSDCYMSIYYPNNQPFKYKQKMTYVDEGLYSYDFTVPYMNGVYMASSYCIIEEENLSKVIVTDDFEDGVSGGTGWATNWVLNGAEFSTSTSHEGIYSLLQENDDNPTRSINGNENFTSLVIDFWWGASSMDVAQGSNDIYYIYVEDASGVDYLLLEVSDDNDDGVWNFFSQTFTLENDNFDFNGTIRFYVTSNGETEDGDYLYIDELNIEFNERIEVNETQYQVVRGSGEVHVTSDFEYTIELSQGELYYTNFYEGFRQYYNVISQVYEDTQEVEISVPIYEPFPCDHVLQVQLYNETSMTWYNMTEVKYEHNINGRNRCTVKFNMDLDVLTTYQVRTDSENYWKQKIVGDYQDTILLNDLIEIACTNYQIANSFDNYTIPIDNQSMSGDSLYDSCESFFNSFYHYSEHLNETFLGLLDTEKNFTVDDMTLLESSFLHLENAAHEVRQYGSTIIDGLNLGDSYSLSILADPYPPTNPSWATYFANISSSALIYYNGVSGQSSVTSALDEINASINSLNVSVGNISTEMPIVMIGGTEYVPNDEGLVAVRLSRVTGSNQVLVTGATCEANILYPNTTSSFATNVSMAEYGSGIYYYNFTVPSAEGVYIYSVDCADGAKDYYAMNTFHVSNTAIDLLQGINITVKEINNTVTLIYDLLVEVDGILAQINTTINNITVSTGNLTPELLSIQNDLLVLNNTLNHVEDFNNELIYLVTDSIVATKEAVDAQEEGNIGRVKNQLLAAEDNLINLQSNLEDEKKVFAWWHLLVVFVAVGITTTLIYKLNFRRNKQHEKL